MEEEGVGVALIQEPWIVQGKVVGLDKPNYTLLVPATQGKIRSCILVRKNFNDKFINIFLFPQFCNGDLTTAICEQSGGPRLLLTSAYLPFEEEDPPSQTLRDLVQWTSVRSLDVVVGCDANAHHSAWGSSDTNGRGESLFEYLLSTNLDICNRGNHPTYYNRIREEVIDITLVSNIGSLSVDNWHVSTKCSFSDHYRIVFTVNIKQYKRLPYRNPRKANWTKFSELVAKLSPPEEEETTNVSSLENNVNLLTSAISEAFRKSCPVSRPPKNQTNSWWTRELKLLRRETRRLHNAAKATKATEDWDCYRNSFNTFKREIKKAKKESWRKFCEELEDTSEFSRLRKCLSKEPCQPSFLLRPDGSFTETGQETLEHLMQTHFPGCQDGTNNIQSSSPSEIQIDELAREIICETKVAWAVNSFQPYKSGGPDGIIPMMLQQSMGTISLWLVKIFRESLSSGHIPNSWRKVRVVFIPKAGKSGHNTAKDFRPISLSSFLLKTLERLIDLHIKSTLNTENFSSAQHAYQKGKSVETALHEVVGTIEKSLKYKEFTMAAFLDVEGAFNHVDAKSIHSALTNIGTNERITRWIDNMLSNRVITSNSGTTSLEKTVTRGTPQGGVISPLLWNLVLNELLISMNRKRIKIVAYADDVVILMTGKFLPTISRLMQSALRELSRWATSSGLMVNPAKTELVLFTRRYKIPGFQLPSLDGVGLNLSNEAKYLGIILDSKLSWKRNTEERMKKAFNALYICKRTFGKRWGLRPHITHWAYNTIIRPILTYGAFVWWEAVKTQSYLKKLKKVQRLACVGITGALRSTPQAALEVILHIPPIDIYVKGIAAKSASRIKAAGMLKENTYGHASVLLSVKHLQDASKTDYLVPTIDLNRDYTIRLPDRKDWQTKLIPNDSGQHIYTDGSKMDSGTGSGVYSEKLSLNCSFRLPDRCSVFQAEIYAIDKAAKSIRLMDLPPTSLTIFVDSQAAIKALASARINSRCVKECRRSLSLIHQHNTTLCWVPGHSGVEGNERADECARKGSELDLQQAVEDISIPLNELHTVIDSSVIADSNRRWSLTTDCRVSKALWPKLDLKRTRSLLGFNRSTISVLIGVITGHCTIGTLASRMGVPHNDFCRSCGDEEEIESVQHLLCECPALQRSRAKYLGDYFFEDLGYLQNVSLEGLATFLKRSKWFRQLR